MKKYLMISIVVLMMLTPLAAASSNEINAVKNRVKQAGVSQQDFTHTVLTEYGATTKCPYCVIASGQLYSIYNSGDLDYYYVSLIYDKGNVNVRSRLKELGVSSVPDVYFDGGYKRLPGAQSNEQPYRNAITQCGIRVVPDIDMDVSVEWKGGGTLKITVNVVNNEPEDYNGHLRVYVVEKESRWDDNGGNPFHYAVLDIPIDRSLSLVSQSQQQGNPRPLGDTYTFKKTWFGALYGFSDITKENTLVVASIFDPDSSYAVETAAAEPTISDGSVTPSSQIQQLLPAIKMLYNQVISKILSNS